MFELASKQPQLYTKNMKNKIEAIQEKYDGYLPTIGLEIHAQLMTETKMFCDSKNDPDEKQPNINVCPVCLGHPGTLPTINYSAVAHVLRVGTALGGTLADYTEFDRKNYFYPDIPKGYQISQYKHPLVTGGELEGVEITRIHLEEDTARSTHDENESSGDSLVDFNRAGVPLMELVTEPVIHDSATASQFAKELQLLLRYLGVGNANMEKGEMRVEANISISKNPDVFGTKVEVKNLNSFKAVEKAIEVEIKRHKAILEEGGTILQETRGWDENKNTTFSQREKEESHDYRYFPDPDLPKLKISEIADFKKDTILQALPELPMSRRIRYTKEWGVKSEDAELFVKEPVLGDFYDEVVSELMKREVNSLEARTLSSNYLTSDVVGMMEEGKLGSLEPKTFATLIELVLENKLSSRGAKDILAEMYEMGGNPTDIAEEKNLVQQNDEDTLNTLVQEIVSEHKQAVDEYKDGKEEALKFLMGQGMRMSKGSANPSVLADLLRKTIKGIE